jgi:hypothetical protein
MRERWDGLKIRDEVKVADDALGFCFYVLTLQKVQSWDGLKIRDEVKVADDALGFCFYVLTLQKVQSSDGGSTATRERSHHIGSHRQLFHHLRCIHCCFTTPSPVLCISQNPPLRFLLLVFLSHKNSRHHFLPLAKSVHVSALYV